MMASSEDSTMAASRRSAAPALPMILLASDGPILEVLLVDPNDTQPVPPTELCHTMTETPTAPRVLIVDDERLLRWALRKALTALGCQVWEVADSQGAIDAVESESGFDAVLLDLTLPDSSDLAPLRRLRAQLPGARIVLMTAFGTEETKAEALRLGASRVLQKPFDVKGLAAQVVESHQQAAAH